MKRIAPPSRLSTLLPGLLLALAAPGIADASQAPATPAPTAGTPPPAWATEELEEVFVRAREPRFVSPTNRDGIGRVWVPVRINGRGPFRLVLDSGATHSAVTERVAGVLGIPLDRSPPVLLRGVTGTSTAPTIQVDSIEVGELTVGTSVMPIVPDAFGGADGLLGTEGLEDKRVYIDFGLDFINVARSRNRRAEPGFVVVELEKDPLPLLVARVRVGNVDAKAIIDTGAQASIANEALKEALSRRYSDRPPTLDQITGATGDTQVGRGLPVSPIVINGLEIRGAHVTFGDMHIFSQWKLVDEPTILIGMDVLGLLDTLVIDYRRRELHLKPRRPS